MTRHALLCDVEKFSIKQLHIEFLQVAAGDGLHSMNAAQLQ